MGIMDLLAHLILQVAGDHAFSWRFLLEFGMS